MSLHPGGGRGTETRRCARAGQAAGGHVSERAVGGAEGAGLAQMAGG